VKKKFGLSDNQIYKSTSRYDQLDIEYDKNNFAPRKYLQEYYTKLSPENKKILQWYHQTYLGLDNCKSLLELGGGPTIYQFISAAPKLESITFTDYLPGNLDLVKYPIQYLALNIYGICLSKRVGDIIRSMCFRFFLIESLNLNI